MQENDVIRRFLLRFKMVALFATFAWLMTMFYVLHFSISKNAQIAWEKQNSCGCKLINMDKSSPHAEIEIHQNFHVYQLAQR